MNVVGNFFGAVAVVLNLVFNALLLVLFVNALLSWIVPPHSDNPYVQFLHRISDAVCNPIRRLFPTVISGIDIAPMIAMLALVFLQRFLVPTLAGLGR